MCSMLSVNLKTFGHEQAVLERFEPAMREVLVRLVCVSTLRLHQD